MNILREDPPNIKEIKAKFPVRDDTVFTYGDTLYAPHVKGAIPADLVEHEATHMDQQYRFDLSPEKWWKKYLEDKEFRFQQELEAYRAQYKFFCVRQHDRNKRSVFALGLARDLSSALYEVSIGTFSCMDLIQNGIK